MRPATFTRGSLPITVPRLSTRSSQWRGPSVYRPVTEGSPGAAVIWGTAIFGALGVSIAFIRPDPMVLLMASVLAGLVFGMLRWEMLVGLMIAVGFFAGSFRMSYASWVAYLIPELLVGFVLFRWVFGRMSSTADFQSRNPITLPFALFVAYGVLEFLHPWAPLMRSLFGFRSWFLYTAMLLVGYEGYRERRQVEFLTRIIVVLALITSAYGIWQWLVGPERLAQLGDWYAIHARTQQFGLGGGRGTVLRVSASFPVSAAFSANMGFITTLALGSYLSPASSARWRLVCAAAIVAMSCGMAVSGSRMGPAILLVGIAVMLMLFRRFRPFIWIMVAWIGGLSLVSNFGGTALLSRLATMLDPKIFFWKWIGPLTMGIATSLPNPLGYGLGFAAGLPAFIIGDGFLDDLRTGAVADSGYGLAGLELGLPGMLLLLFFAVQVARCGLRAWQTLPDPASKDVFLGPAVWAVSFPVTLLFASMTASAPLSLYHWLLIGMLLRAGASEAAHVSVRRSIPTLRPMLRPKNR